MLFKKSNKLFCFSPPVMIATFVIEIALLAYTVIKYKMSPLGRIVAAMLLFLATFQYAEYQVCETGGPSAGMWSRIGFMAIALLPALGMHLIAEISGRTTAWRARALVALAYLSSLAFVLSFGLHETAFVGHECAGNYAVFQLVKNLGGLFFIYYYFWLFVGMGVALYFARSARPKIRKALYLHVLGYLCFVIPTGIVNMLNPTTLSGLPSVMCGFAVSYALILAFLIVPLVLSERKDTPTKTKKLKPKNKRA